MNKIAIEAKKTYFLPEINSEIKDIFEKENLSLCINVIGQNPEDEVTKGVGATIILNVYSHDWHSHPLSNDSYARQDKFYMDNLQCTEIGAWINPGQGKKTLYCVDTEVASMVAQHYATVLLTSGFKDVILQDDFVVEEEDADTEVLIGDVLMPMISIPITRDYKLPIFGHEILDKFEEDDMCILAIVNEFPIDGTVEYSVNLELSCDRMMNEVEDKFPDDPKASADEYYNLITEYEKTLPYHVRRWLTMENLAEGDYQFSCNAESYEDAKDIAATYVDILGERCVQAVFLDNTAEGQREEARQREENEKEQSDFLSTRTVVEV